MMKKTLNQLINLALIIQLLMPQYLWAQSSTTPQSQPRTNADSFADILRGTTNIAEGILNTLRQQYNQAEAQNQLRQLTSQMNPHVCPVNGQPAPCVSEIFPECNILNTRPNFTEPSVCINGIDPNDPASGAKAGQALGFFEHYTQMENSYKNFMLSSNNTSNLGVGCLNSRAEELGRKLQQREKEIDNLINKMQKTQDDFKKKAERDRAQIEDAQALLLGEQFQGNKSALEKNTVRFDNAFNDPACRSMLDGEGFQNTGKSGGLKGIQDSVARSVNQKPQGNGFSAAEYTPQTAQAVERQLDQITRFLAGEVNREGVSGISEQLSVGSAYGLNSSGALRDAIVQERQKAQQRESDIGNKIDSFAVGNTYQGLKTAALNPNLNMDQQLLNFERTTKNNCLAQQTNIASLINENLSIINPQGSDAANRSADNAYAKFVRNTLARNDITIEEKMNLIANQEKQDGNSMFLVDTQTSATIDGSSLKVTSRLTPAAFIKLHVDNCKAQFDTNATDSGFTNRQIMDNFKKARAEVSAFRSSLASNLVNAINDRVKNCSDSYQANATGVAVCSANSFATASSDFCLKRANSCATNMRQCLEKANKQVQQVTEKRDTALAQYTANIEKNEADLRKIYEQVEALTSVDGINIAASLKQSLTLPTENLQFHINKEDRTFIRGLEDLEVANPDEYFNLMKDNLLSLKEEIKKQNVAVMNGTQDRQLTPGSPAQSGVLGHIANITENMNKAITEVTDYKSKCQAAFQAYMNGMRQAAAQAAQQRAEQDQARGEYCARMQSLGRTPGCESMDFFDEIAGIAATQGDGDAARRLSGYNRYYRRFCTESGADGQQDQIEIFRREHSSGLRFCERAFRRIPDEASRANYVSTPVGCKALLECVYEAPVNGDIGEPKGANACPSRDDYDSEVILANLGGNENGEARSEDEIRSDAMSQLGENRSVVCGSLDNSGSVVGRAFMDAAQTSAEAALQNGASRLP